MGTKKSQNSWSKTGRKPEQVIAETRRKCRKEGLTLRERQNGTSHWVGTVYREDQYLGRLVVPRGHGELKKGTWGSIYGTIVKLGLAVLVLGVLGAMALL